MSSESAQLSGIILITVPTIVFGGFFLFTQVISRAKGYVDNPLRRSLFTAGHAHAGVLVMFSLILQPLVDQTDMSSALTTIARLGVPLAAILMPMGFFLSVPMPNAERPNGMRYFVYAGAISVATSVFILGVGLITTA